MRGIPAVDKTPLFLVALSPYRRGYSFSSASRPLSGVAIPASAGVYQEPTLQGYDPKQQRNQILQSLPWQDKTTSQTIINPKRRR